jgi:hypothetical protein
MPEATEVADGDLAKAVDSVATNAMVGGCGGLGRLGFEASVEGG